MEFLRIHDNKTKRLYFLWQQQQTISPNKPHKCGCVGGCFYYSVFDPYFNKNLAEDDLFFNLKKSISRANTNFGVSLFVPSKHILHSHPMMVDKYPIEYYSYKLNTTTVNSQIDKADDNISTDSSHLSYKRFNDDKILNPACLSTLRRRQSVVSGSNWTLNKDTATLKRVNSKLAKNRTSQSELSLNRQKSLNRFSQNMTSGVSLPGKRPSKNSSASLFSSVGMFIILNYFENKNQFFLEIPKIIN